MIFAMACELCLRYSISKQVGSLKSRDGKLTYELRENDDVYYQDIKMRAPNSAERSWYLCMMGRSLTWPSTFRGSRATKTVALTRIMHC